MTRSRSGARWLILGAFGQLAWLAFSGPLAAAADLPHAKEAVEDRTCSLGVSEIYPTTAELPENLLRFYVYFTQPMEREGILSSIEIVDAEGQTMPRVFLENRYELWSPDSRRLTLILDPGRVKTGLTSHDLLGRALRAGQRYTLVVHAGVQDVEGCRLPAAHRKAFVAVTEDRAAPDVQHWQLDIPPRGSRQALAIQLDGPVDHLSLAYRLRILDTAGEIVAGSIELADDEARWLFTPTLPWPAKLHHVVVDPVLEDLAGNRPGRLFDLTPATGRSESAVPPDSLVEGPITLSFTPE